MGSDGNPKLCSHDDLPTWAQDNEFILRGYRTPGGTSDELQARLADSTSASTLTSTSTANGASNGARQRAGNGKEEADDSILTTKLFEHDSVYVSKDHAPVGD